MMIFYFKNILMLILILSAVGVSAQADSLIVDNHEVLMTKKKWLITYTRLLLRGQNISKNNILK